MRRNAINEAQVRKITRNVLNELNLQTITNAKDRTEFNNISHIKSSIEDLKYEIKEFFYDRFENSNMPRAYRDNRDAMFSVLDRMFDWFDRKEKQASNFYDSEEQRVRAISASIRKKLADAGIDENDVYDDEIVPEETLREILSPTEFKWFFEDGNDLYPYKH